MTMVSCRQSRRVVFEEPNMFRRKERPLPASPGQRRPCHFAIMPLFSHALFPRLDSRISIPHFNLAFQSLAWTLLTHSAWVKRSVSALLMCRMIRTTMRSTKICCPHVKLVSFHSFATVNAKRSTEGAELDVVEYSDEVTEFINTAVARGRKLVTKEKLLASFDDALNKIKDRKLRDDIRNLLKKPVSVTAGAGIEPYFSEFVTQATSVSTIREEHFVKPSGDFSKDLILALHYPTFCTAHPENGYAADESNPTTNSLLDVGFSGENSLWLEEFYNRMRPPPGRGCPTADVSAQETDPNPMDMSRNLVQIQHKFSERMERLSSARFALVFRACQRERLLKRQDMRTFKILYNNEVEIQAAARYRDGQLYRIYFFAWHPEGISWTAYRKADLSVALQYDVAMGIAAALAKVNFKYGFHSAAVRRLLQCSEKVRENLERRLFRRQIRFVDGRVVHEKKKQSKKSSPKTPDPRFQFDLDDNGRFRCPHWENTGCTFTTLSKYYLRKHADKPGHDRLISVNLPQYIPEHVETFLYSELIVRDGKVSCPGFDQCHGSYSTPETLRVHMASCSHAGYAKLETSRQRTTESRYAARMALVRRRGYEPLEIRVDKLEKSHGNYICPADSCEYQARDTHHLYIHINVCRAASHIVLVVTGKQPDPVHDQIGWPVPRTDGRYDCPGSGCTVVRSSAAGMRAHIKECKACGAKKLTRDEVREKYGEPEKNADGKFACPVPDCTKDYAQKADAIKHAMVCGA